jgi:predicted ribosomally synthesized peptide with SipW-like signal peptide
MKKILGLSVVAMMIMAMVGGGTWAYFSDPETSSGNILSAGTLDLTLDGNNADIKVIETAVTDVAPGDNGSEYVDLEAGGSLAGELDIAFSAITNVNGSGGTEYELSGSGELGGKATIAVWLDVDNSGTWNTGDIELEPAGADPFDSDATLDGATIDSFGSVSWDDVASGDFSGPWRFYIDWDVDAVSVGNEIQGDSASFDITFTLEQTSAD